MSYEALSYAGLLGPHESSNSQKRLALVRLNVNPERA